MGYAIKMHSRGFLILTFSAVPGGRLFLSLEIIDYAITFSNHAGRFHDPRTCQLFYVGPLNI